MNNIEITTVKHITYRDMKRLACALMKSVLRGTLAALSEFGSYDRTMDLELQYGALCSQTFAMLVFC